eukprot:TRINITY_DN5506_c0_g1_i1.p1 TRINITY_DN5506_c0_g1~~TRINITY_DN5506_c0_g1_i1.p1  ORF type:complete len:683 (+),score=194.47 TRINITY_DN5506_c0_g1_i1:132-2051(+)
MEMEYVEIEPSFQAIPASNSRKMELLEQRMSSKSLSPLSDATPPLTSSQSKLNFAHQFEKDHSELGSSESEQEPFPHHENNHPVDDGQTKTKKKRKNYTLDEDQKIQEGYKRFGSDWVGIVKWGQLDRTPHQIKERFKRIKKKSETAVEVPAKRAKLEDEVKDTPSIIVTSHHTEPTNVERSLELAGVEKERKALEEKREKLLEVEKVLHEKEESIKQYEAHVKQKANEEEKVEFGKLEQIRKSTATILQQKAEQEKRLIREVLLRESSRLGTIVSERHGTSYVEVWQDGQVFRDIAKKEVCLQNLKEHLKKEKRELTKLIRKKGQDGNDEEMDELLQLQEIQRVRIMNLKRDEAEIASLKEKLNIEKNAHIRELKRVHDEDQSRFNNQAILLNRYVLLTLLGKGGFSEVYKAFDLQELKEVACKIHQLNTLWTDRKKENYIRHACREYSIHKSVVNSKIVRLFDVFEIDENSFCTVLEYCSGPDLDLYLKTHQTLTEREAKCIITQIFSGLQYLSQQKRPIIHYDLKPGNILFHDGEVKITDFGLSKIMDENQDALELTSQGAGTYWYLPPECFEVGKEPPKISSKVDVWAAGVIFYQMLFGKKPFGNNLTQQKILADNVIPTSVLEFPAKPTVSKEA